MVAQAVQAPRPDRALLAFDILWCAMIASAEAAVMILCARSLLPLVFGLIFHGIITACMAIALDWRERAGRDARLLALALVTVSVSGPIGAILSVCLGLQLLFVRRETALLAKWYERISGQMSDDAVVELHERIHSRRTIDPFLDSTTQFSSIMRSGPLEEKQRVLSVIAQKYHPDFAPLLAMALKSADPPIRVQAAAIVARLRNEARLKFASLLGNAATHESALSTTPSQRLALVSEISSRITSGLLDEQDVAHGRALAKALCAAILEASPDDAGAGLALAHLDIQDGDYVQAADRLTVLVEGGSSEAVEPLRSCLLRLGRYQQFAALPQSAPAEPNRNRPRKANALVPVSDATARSDDVPGRAA